MLKTTQPLIISFSVNALIATGALAASPANDAELDTVLITAQRADRVSRGATGLDLDIKDTPQSISVVTSFMEDYGASNLNDALRLATGISVEEWETNRANYVARGFEIKNTQMDGVGLPNNWGIVTGAMDAFGYEKLEVIRGANGLLTGVGNAAGTINYVRKRPTNNTGLALRRRRFVGRQARAGRLLHAADRQRLYGPAASSLRMKTGIPGCAVSATTASTSTV